jgi:hypothetical protein
MRKAETNEINQYLVHYVAYYTNYSPQNIIRSVASIVLTLDGQSLASNAITCMFSFGYFPGLMKNILHQAFEDGPDRGFRNVGKT